MTVDLTDESGVTGPWTSFSPAECAAIAAAFGVVATARAVVGLVPAPADAAAEESLRLKACAGAGR